MSTRTVEIDDHRLDISKVEKELYPADHLAKGDVVGYYRAVAPVMMPHLRGRPLSLRRYPDGIDDGGFFQKEASGHFPDWLRVVPVPRRTGGSDVRQVVCDDAASLVYLADQASLELHGWLSTAESLDRPDRLVIDVDPPSGTAVGDLRRVVRALRALFEAIELQPFLLATGGKGFHVVAPLDGEAGYDVVRPFARELADRVVRDDPDRLTVEQRKDKRGERIFLDTNRNSYAQTAIVPYSLRGRPGAPVATPLDWAELGRAEPAGHHLGNLRNRLAHKEDPWRSIAEHGRSAQRARRLLTRA